MPKKACIGRSLKTNEFRDLPPSIKLSDGTILAHRKHTALPDSAKAEAHARRIKCRLIIKQPEGGHYIYTERPL